MVIEFLFKFLKSSCYSDRYDRCRESEHFRYLSLQFEKDVLVGATSIGWTEHVGALRGLIQSRVRLGDRKAALAADPTRFMAAYVGAAQKVA